MMSVAWLATAILIAAPEETADLAPLKGLPALSACAPATTAPDVHADPSVAPSETELDPLETFLKIVARYRRLTTYRDSVKLVQVMQRVDQEPQRQEWSLVCEIVDGKLRVTTPASQVVETLGLKIPVRGNADSDQTAQNQAVWLAPHMAMKYADNPLGQFRAGVKEGFAATDAERIIEDERSLVHVEMKSAGCVSDDCPAAFDLYVNTESMLIERIEGHQTLPDGAELQTTVEITPQEIEAPTESMESTQPTT
jgi:hypothetical protein